MIYLVIKQIHPLYSAAKLEFTKMSLLQKKAQCVSWFVETKSYNQAPQNFTRKYGKSHLRSIPFDYDIKRLSRQVGWNKEKE